MNRSNRASRVKLALTSMLVALSMFGTSAAEHSRLPTGVVAGDMDLSPFYRWDARLPKRPGVLLREEALPRQHDMDAANVSSHSLYIARRALALWADTGQWHSLSSLRRASIWRLASAGVGARHGRHRRYMRSVLDNARHA
jgi:hypothetical protein